MVCLHLTVPDTETKTDIMGTEPNGNLFWCLSLQYKKLHTMMHKTFLPSGSIYTSVCHSVHGGGVSDRHPPPAGRHIPPPSRRLLQRTVRILLECILVLTVSVSLSVSCSVTMPLHVILFSPCLLLALLFITITHRTGPSPILSSIHTVAIETMLNLKGGNKGQELKTLR